MFNFFKRNKQETQPEQAATTLFFLTETPQGRWSITSSTPRNGTTFLDVVGNYSRKRDAIRGAQRKGILLENV